MNEEKHIESHQKNAELDSKNPQPKEIKTDMFQINNDPQTEKDKSDSYLKPQKFTKEETNNSNLKKNINKSNPNLSSCLETGTKHENSDSCISNDNLEKKENGKSNKNENDKIRQNSNQIKKKIVDHVTQNSSGAGKNNSNLGSDFNAIPSDQDKQLVMTCIPTKFDLAHGKEKTINCTVENRGNTPINLKLECLGLSNEGIGCYIEGGEDGTIMSFDVNSAKQFVVKIVVPSSAKISNGQYPFLITAN